MKHGCWQLRMQRMLLAMTLEQCATFLLKYASARERHYRHKRWAEEREAKREGKGAEQESAQDWR